MRPGTLVAAAATAGLGCGAPPEPLDGVWVGGCADVTADGGCLVAPGAGLVLWLPDAEVEEVSAFLDEVPLVPEPADVGARVRLAAPPEAGQVEVEVGGAVWAMPLRGPRPPEDPLDAASRASRAKIDRVPVEELITALRDSAEAHREAGHQLAAIKDAQLAVWLSHNQSGGVMRARQILAQWKGTLDHNLDAAYLEAFHTGLLEADLGAIDDARRRFAYAADLAERADRPDRVWMAKDRLSASFAAAGQYAEALDLALEVVREGGSEDPCAPASSLNNLAWTSLLALHSGAMSPTEVEARATAGAVDLLEQAHEALDPACGRAPTIAAHIGINRALEALEVRQAPQEALELLQSLPAAVIADGASLRVWDRWIRLRAGLALGQRDGALAALTDLQAAANQSGDPLVTWRACVGQALWEEASQRDLAALETLAHCAQLRTEAAMQVAINGGRDTFVADMNEAVRLEVSLRARSGDQAGALRQLRRHRAGHLNELAMLRRGVRAPGQLNERAAAMARYAELRRKAEGSRGEWSWELSAEALRQRDAARQELDRAAEEAFSKAFGGDAPANDELAAPGPGEVLLSWTGELAWGGEPGGLGFALTSEGLVVRPHPPVPDEPTLEDLSRALLAPFADVLTRAERVTFAPTGRFARFDLHAAAVEGRALALSVPVAYSLDLGRPRVGVTRSERALVVSDPSGDLPGARREGEVVAAALRASGAEVVHLPGAEAGLSDLLRHVDRVDLLHYAGHGTFRQQGWSAGLRLADGRDLLATDVLTAPGVPARVVLSGCSTAASRPTWVESLGLAQAFLVAGSREVVATTRPVRDEVAGRFSATWHRALARTGDGAVAYLEAVQAIAADDWAAFRRLVD